MATDELLPDEARQAYHNSFAAKVQRFMVANSKAFNQLSNGEDQDGVGGGVASSSKPHPPPESEYYYY